MSPGDTPEHDQANTLNMACMSERECVAGLKTRGETRDVKIIHGGENSSKGGGASAWPGVAAKIS